MRSIFLALAAFSIYSAVDASIKWIMTLSENPLSPPVVYFLNILVGTIATATLAYKKGKFRLFIPKRPSLLILRGLTGGGNALCVFYAFSQLPMSNVYAILFTTPIFITILSIPLLGETIRWRRWTAILVGFCGVLIILRPTGDSFVVLPSSIALLAAVLSASTLILIRKASQQNHNITIVFYGNFTGLLFATCFMPFFFDTININQIFFFIIIGTCASAATLLITEAFATGNASLVAPFQYSQILWGILWGFILFKDQPDSWVLIGAVIVIGSGIYIMMRQRKNREQNSET